MAGFVDTVVAVLAAIGGTVGLRGATEEPRHTVVERVGAIEIRHYAPRLAAETTVGGSEMAARNEGFRRVAGYIFGANQGGGSIAMTAPVAQSAAGSQKIAMTAPVAQTARAGDAWTVQFFMPTRYTRATLPEPTDPAVRIVEVPAQDYAVLRFSGARDGPAVRAKTTELTEGLAASRWRIAGTPTAWFYDPPWTVPFLRRNEVAVPVAPER